MSSQIAELSQRLQSALDQSYNVADMDTVLHVISTLEKIQITKEQLETTRLGKYINHLRRKTTNESLARRAKSLLRKWREMVFIPQQQQQQHQQHQSELITSTTRPSIVPSSSYAFLSTNKDLSLSTSYGISDRISHGNNASNHGYDNQITSNTSLISANQNDSSNQSEGFHQLSKVRHGYDESAVVFSNINIMNKDSSRDIDPYRTPSLMNDNSRSPVSISSLPKIPKIKNSSSHLRSNKNIDRSHSPLVNLTETSPLAKGFQRNTSTYMHDDNTRHSHNHDAKLLSLNASIVNGRDAYNVNSLLAMDNSSNSSTIHSYDKERGMIALNINQSNESLNSETKKKHKKHKKDKKSKKQKHQSSPVHPDRSLVSSNVIPEISDNNLSNSSMGHIPGSTFLSNEQKPKVNENVFTDSFDALKTSIPPPISKQSMVTSKYEDLSFTGKFRVEKNDDESIIHIDSSSSSSSNSPKPDQMNVIRAKNPSSLDLVASRSSSPTKMNVLLSKISDMGYIHAVTDDEQSNLNILRHTTTSIANPPAESLSQDISMANTNNDNSSVPINLNESETVVKKRGRKKGSKGVDSRLANASNSSQSQQGNAQYYDPISFTSLKNQIDLIRGTTKKVKTTKELLAELQNRKPLTYNDADDNLIEPPQPASIFDDKLNADLNDDLDEIRVATQQKTPSKQNKKSKSSSKRRHSGDSIVEKEVTEKNIEPKNNIDDEIQSLQSQLPLVDKAELLKWQELIQNETIVCTCELIECEDENESSELAQADSGSDLYKKNQLPEDTENNFMKPNVPTENIALSKLSFDEMNMSISAKDSSSSTSSTIVGAQQPILHQPQAPQPTKKVTVKSIFDLDYEEDPLIQINHNNNDTSLLINNYNISSKSDSILNNNNKDNSNNEISNDKNKQNCDEVKFDSEAITNPLFSGVPLKGTESMTKNIAFPSTAGQSDDNDNEMSAVPIVYTQKLDHINTNSIAEINTDPNNLNTQSDLKETPPQKRFRIEEDPECKAKEYYVTSKQLITQFHVEKLHNAFVPNVNGNFDNSEATDEPTIVQEMPDSNDIIIIDDSDEKNKSDSDQKAEEDGNCSNETEVIDDLKPHITEQSIGLYDRVVPLCNHLIMDSLPKNLSDIKINVNESDEVELHIFVSKIKSDAEASVIKTDFLIETEPLPNVSDDNERANEANDDIDELYWQKKQDCEVFAYHMEKIDCSAFERYRRHVHNPNILFDNNKASDSSITTESHTAMDVDDGNDQDPVDNNFNRFEIISFACNSNEKNDDDGNSDSSADNSDSKRVDVLPSIDDNAQIDDNEENGELFSDMDSVLDDVEMLPVADENAMDYRSHLCESVDTIHLTGKQFDSNGDYYLENDAAGSGSWYAQAEKDPSYMDERSNFITLESFSHPTDDDDDDDDNSGDDQASDDDDDDIEGVDRVNRMYDSEFNNQLDRDQLLANSEDVDDIDPMLVCCSELGHDKRSSGLDDDDNSNSDACSDGVSSTGDTDDSSHVDCYKYAFKSRNGDFKDANKDNLHLRSRTDSPLIHSDSSSSSESSPYYNDRPCPTHYGRFRYRRSIKKVRKEINSTSLSSLDLKPIENDSNFHVSGQINPTTHLSSDCDSIESAKDIMAGNRTNFKGILSDPDDVNCSPTESEAEIVVNFPPVVEIHQQHSQPNEEVDDIRNVDIPLECMLPEKLFQNEDSNDSVEQKNQTVDHESKEQINSLSIAETLEQNIDPSNEQKEHIDDEEVMHEVHHSDSNESLPSRNNNRLSSFNNLGTENEIGSKQNGEKFREWYEVVHIKSYNDELLTILPYVVID